MAQYFVCYEKEGRKHDTVVSIPRDSINNLRDIPDLLRNEIKKNFTWSIIVLINFRQLKLPDE